MKPTIVIAGGTGAIGQACCHAMVAKGYSIKFSFAENENRARDIASALADKGGEVGYCQVRFGTPDSSTQIDQLLDVPGILAGVVYASGPDIGQPFFSSVPTQEWQRIINQDVLGFMEFASQSIARLRANAPGAIVAVTTAATKRHPAKDALSSVPKTAIEAAIRAIAREEGRYGIRANSVGPGMLDIGLGKRIVEQALGDGAEEKIKRLIPLGRFGTAQDIAEAVAFLVSDAAKYISGQSLSVDGGWSS